MTNELEHYVIRDEHGIREHTGRVVAKLNTIKGGSAGRRKHNFLMTLGKHIDLEKSKAYLENNCNQFSGIAMKK